VIEPWIWSEKGWHEYIPPGDIYIFNMASICKYCNVEAHIVRIWLEYDPRKDEMSISHHIGDIYIFNMATICKLCNVEAHIVRIWLEYDPKKDEMSISHHIGDIYIFNMVSICKLCNVQAHIVCIWLEYDPRKDEMSIFHHIGAHLQYNDNNITITISSQHEMRVTKKYLHMRRWDEIIIGLTKMSEEI